MTDWTKERIEEARKHMRSVRMCLDEDSTPPMNWMRRFVEYLDDAITEIDRLKDVENGLLREREKLIEENAALLIDNAELEQRL